MTGKNWQASGKDVTAAVGLLCATVAVWPAGAWAATNGFSPDSYLIWADPGVVWEILVGSFIVVSFLAAIIIWVMSALRKAKRSHLRRNAFISSALNNLSQGVVMTDSRKRVIFCNDRYLEIYGLVRSDIRSGITGPELLDLRRAKGMLDVSNEDYYRSSHTPEGLVSELPDGRWIAVRQWKLPNGGSVATHEDCSEQRRLAKQLAITKNFLESVINTVPVCIAAKNIEDGRYILTNQAFEKFAGFPREYIVGKRSDDIYAEHTAAAIAVADRRAAAAASDGYTLDEMEVDRGSGCRTIASKRVVARNERGEPEFLITMFEDVTDRKSLSRELENSKKFLELVVDNIPVSLIVQRVDDGHYMLANRSAETISTGAVRTLPV